MRIPKRYGESKVDPCPFCAKQATAKNKQQVPVCLSHKEDLLQNLKCACGDYLDIKTGKFGAYAHCMHCGNLNLKKALEMNPHALSNVSHGSTSNRSTSHNSNAQKNTSPKEITITSDELDLF